MIDEDSHETRAFEIIGHRHDGCEILIEPLAQVPAGEQIASIGGDGAYDTRVLHESWRPGR